MRKTQTRLSNRLAQNNQSTATRRLGTKLCQSYRKLHSWRAVAQQHAIFNEHGQVNPGLAENIAVRDYEPKRPETRRRLGLPEICPTCERRIRTQEPGKVRPVHWRSLIDLDPNTLRRIFDNREVMA
jgi:hypothetical protein